jgi:uncharacterized delta-60 repeat protein
MLVGVVFSAGAQAAPGDLDLTFSGDGKQRTDFRTGLSGAAAIVRQPDGKIVAVGTRRTGDLSDFAVARYNADGSLDTSFSGDGRQVTDLGSGYEAAYGVALQADGKIVAVGGGGAFGGSFALARYNPNGSLDTSFSGDGKQTTDFGGYATGVAIQADGKIVAVGASDDFAGDVDFALARYNADGSLDTSFSGDGKQTTDVGDLDYASGVALQGDGKIVAVGSTYADQAGGFDGFALARYNADGSLDTSFSGDGKQTTDFGNSFDSAFGLTLQADGKVVAVGRTSDGYAAPSDFALARYNANGSLDTSFSGDGKQTTDFGDQFEQANGVALQGDGKIVAVGRRSAGGVNDYALARYNPNGSLDTSFSGDGKQTTDFGATDDAATGVALQPDGRVVAVGATGDGAYVGDFALARYNANGSLDTSFSGDGKQTTGFAGPDGANGVALQADGKIVAVGETSGEGGGDFALARYNANGSLDTSFSGDGLQATDFYGVDRASGVALQADGKIVAVGTRSAGGVGAFALARYNPNGSLDANFSGDGKQTTGFGTLNPVASGVALQADGKIVAVGTTRASNTAAAEFALARFNPNGSLDASFSGDGLQTTGFGGIDRANGVALQANGKIVAVGTGHSDFALARYNANGSLDTSFSGDGLQRTDFGDFGDRASGVALQADGKIVVVGRAGGTDDFALARYNANGSLDTSFSGDGLQTTGFGVGANVGANGVALQADGKIVAVGLAGGGATGNDFALARYNSDGSLDPSFSGDGIRRTNFGGSDGANGVALQGDGGIVAVGVGLGTDGTSDFALARYLGG